MLATRTSVGEIPVLSSIPLFDTLRKRQGAPGPAAGAQNAMHRAGQHGRTNLVLLGQPRSGTSWLEAAVFSLVAAFCLRRPTSTEAEVQCSVVGERLLQRQRNFVLRTPAGTVHFTVKGKHRFPPAGYRVNNCTRQTAMLTWGPCRLALMAKRPNRSYERQPAQATVPALIDRCAANCNSSHATLGASTRRFLMIYRDPRASARSHCLWLVPGGNVAPGTNVAPPGTNANVSAVRRCMRRMFPLHGAWLKYREIWLTMNPDLRHRTTLISYEQLVFRPLQARGVIAGRRRRPHASCSVAVPCAGARSRGPCAWPERQPGLSTPGRGGAEHEHLRPSRQPRRRPILRQLRLLQY